MLKTTQETVGPSEEAAWQHTEFNSQIAGLVHGKETNLGTEPASYDYLVGQNRRTLYGSGWNQETLFLQDHSQVHAITYAHRPGEDADFPEDRAEVQVETIPNGGNVKTSVVYFQSPEGDIVRTTTAYPDDDRLFGAESRQREILDEDEARMLAKTLATADPADLVSAAKEPLGAWAEIDAHASNGHANAELARRAFASV